MKLNVIANINIEQTFEAKDKQDAIEQMENIELPHGYVTDSFEIVKVLDKEDNEV